MTREQLMAQYGELTVQLEIIQTKHMEVKRQIAEMLQKQMAPQQPKDEELVNAERSKP